MDRLGMDLAALVELHGQLTNLIAAATRALAPV
jgi:hypothetical protein